MKPERWQQIDKILEDALEMEGAQREAFLRQTCAGDKELRRAVEDLLAADEQAKSLMETPALDVVAQELAQDQGVRAGQTIGPYEIISLLGVGGMGEVYLAEDTTLERQVAMKVLPLELGEDAIARKRFLREARSAAAIDHPFICSIHEVNRSAGQDFIVMEYVEGQTLQEKLNMGPLPLKEALGIAQEIAEALEVAHQRNIAHRDLKPSNIMLTTGGHVKVMDFGLAKRVTQPGGSGHQDISLTADLTKTGTTLGTPAYMSPEQLRGEDVDTRSDIFSFGVLLYETMTGVHPFGKTGLMETASSILKDEPLPLSRHIGHVSPLLQHSVKKMLAKDPDRRYQVIREVRTDLGDLIDEIADLPTTVSSAKRPQVAQPRWKRAVPWGLGMAGAAGLLIVAVALMAWWVRAPVTSSDGVLQIDSIAVLPLANLSANPDEAFFADGMTDALIGNLAKISALKVISRTSVMRYRDVTRPLSEIAGELGVEAIVEGSVQRAGDRIRITANLIDASAERVLWAESYDHEVRDVLTLQGEIARAIAEQVQARITPEEEARLRSARAVDPEVHELYLLGRHNALRQTPAAIEQAIEYSEEAIARDPTFALAHAGLASAYWWLDLFGGGGGVGAHADELRASTLRALELDPELAEVHVLLGQIRFYYDWDWPGTESAYQRAIQLNPNLGDAYYFYGFYLTAMGRFDEAVASSARAVTLDPLSANRASGYGRQLYRARRYDEAIAQYQRALELDPNQGGAWSRLADAYTWSGQYQEALAIYDRLEQTTDPQRWVALRGVVAAAMGQTEQAIAVAQRLEGENPTRQSLAVILAQLGRSGDAIEILENRVEARSIIPFALRDPAWDPLLGHPRFNALLEGVGLPIVSPPIAPKQGTLTDR